MKQAPLFRRQFFVQREVAPEVAPRRGGPAEYVRIHGTPSNPGAVLDGRRVALSPGGMIDVICDARGGAGLGKVSYPEGLRGAVKRGVDLFTYRFTLTRAAVEGQTFQVSVWGTDAQPAFRFTVVVGAEDDLGG